MVTRLGLAAAAVLALARTASAQPLELAGGGAPTTAPEPPSPSLLGFRMGVGVEPIDHRATTVLEIGLAIEHPLAHHVRLTAEYDWLWLRGNRMEHGDGQRIQLGLRRRLAESSGRTLRFYADAELGGGLALADAAVAGLHVLPDAFAGLRAGYDLVPRAARSPSRGIETELLARVLAVPGGTGWMTGIGFCWLD